MPSPYCEACLYASLDSQNNTIFGMDSKDSDGDGDLMEYLKQ
ncbi:MAG: hypothetical protein RLZZ387_593 [Chloroflexota bacterium]|jgi:hypothetical protein